MKVALVYDRANRVGGAERVLMVLHKLFPEAPLYTAVYDPEGAPWAKEFDVRPSFLQRFPGAPRHHELYGWLTPLAFETFNFQDYDLVISITSAEAKAVITRPETVHICYCLTPTRYLWGDTWLHFTRYPFKFSLLGPLIKTFGQLLTTPLRMWDQVAAQRPDHYLTISETVKVRIKKYYGREAKVIYPPVEVEKFRSKGKGGSCRPGLLKGYFLVVSRLVPYKRVDIAVEAFNRLGLPLVVVGEGAEGKRLKRMAKSNIVFTKRLTEPELISYYQGCQALVFPGEEDFGLVLVEAQAAGKPVVAFKGGGALESISDGQTGLLFSPQTPEALVEAVNEFGSEIFPPDHCLSNAQRFDAKRFEKAFLEVIETVMKNKTRPRHQDGP